MKDGSLNNVKVYFREYCNRTSVHGFQYFGENRTILERIWWISAFAFCLSCCVVSINNIYENWKESPVFVSFSNKLTPIHEIPFPSITICPELKSAQDKFNFTATKQMIEDGLPVDPTKQKYYEYMSLICNQSPKLNYTGNDTFSEEFFEVMDLLKPKLKSSNCFFFDDGGNCDMDFFFVPIITDEGVCYTFNSFNRTDIFKDNVIHFKNYHANTEQNSTWSYENGYVNDEKFAPYPFRAYFAGADSGFRIDIETPHQDLDHACKKSFQGYKVLLHAPPTIPRPSKKYVRVPLDHNVVMAVNPVMIQTSKRVKAYNPERRTCYFTDERPLKYFKFYTATYCNLECITNYTLNQCGCVNFFMPRENGTKICGTNKIECMKNADRAMKTISYLFNLNGKPDLRYLPYGVTLKVVLDCNCLPLCSDLSYVVASSQVEWDWKRLRLDRRSVPLLVNQSHVSSFTVFFESDNFITSVRNELFGPLDFLANFGGLLGLFTGFSVLSLLEILYFLTIRLFSNVRLYGKWAGPEIHQ